MKPPIRVAYVLTPVTFGGAEKVNLNFLSNVDRKQIDLHVIALVRPWEKPPLLVEEIERLGISYSTLPVAARPRPGNDPIQILKVIWALYSMLRQQRFDLLHTHGYFADICGIPIARLLRLPALSTCHGFIDTDRKLQLYNRMDLWALKLCSRVIAVSDELRNGLEKLGIDEDKIRVIANAVPVPPLATQNDKGHRSFRQQHGNSQEEFVFVYIGRLSEEKGLLYLLEAFSELIKSDVCARLVLIGDGPQRKMLERRVVELDIERQVSLTGFQKQISPWLASADCFVLPSLTEGTPMALLEAMAAGIPIVATGVGGVPDVITDGVNGLLVPCADVGTLRNSMSRIIDHPELREKYSFEARKTVESHYSVQPWCEKILLIYRDLCLPDDHRV